MDEHKIVYLDILAYYNTIIENMIAAKVDKAEGKQLSTNDFTDAEKTNSQISPRMPHVLLSRTCSPATARQTP